MPRSKITSVVRSLEILECFKLTDREWTLKALVDELDLPQTTVFRQVSNLVESGYLQQDPVRKSYQIGPKLLLLSSAILRQSDLRKVAHPQLMALSNSVQETINLCMLTGRLVFYLDRIESQYTIAVNGRLGYCMPAHATAVGKLLLSAQSEEYIADYCKHIGEMAAFTENTITDPKLLLIELAKIRADGYAIDSEEIEKGLICVAAPVYDLSDKMVAAISISGPVFRMRVHLNEMLDLVRETAKNISHLNGHVD